MVRWIARAGAGLALLAAVPAMGAENVLAGLTRHFEANAGQTDASVDFMSRGDGYTLFLARDGATLKLRAVAESDCAPCARQAGVEPAEGAPRYAALKMALAGASEDAVGGGEGLLDGPSRYITPARAMVQGNRLAATKPVTREADRFARVRYRGVYSGIDLVYYGKGRELEYDFHVAPGADPDAIRIRFEGASDIRLDEGGSLVLQTGAGAVVQQAPVAFQERDGAREPVESRFVLERGEVRIRVGEYDRALPLVIDPVLSYGTFLGGDAADDVQAAGVDAQGNIIVCGYTDSTDFPRVNAAFGTFAGSYDGFVSKISADGKTLLYSTYIGGVEPMGWDSANGLAVDAQGNVVVAGRLSMDVLLVKLTAAGAPVYALSFGGISNDTVNAVALGADDTAYLAGVTLSQDYDGSEEYEGFPVWPIDAYQTVRLTGGDAFVCRIDQEDPENLLFVYSTYLGGTGYLLDDEVKAMAVDAAGHAYVAGVTPSADFPVVGGHQAQAGGYLTDAFLAKVSPDGRSLLYSTYFGGGYNDEVRAVVADNAGNAWVTGWTNSIDFPSTPGTYAPEWALGDCDPSPTGILPCADAFLAKVDTTKTGAASLVWSTFFGGNMSDYGYGLARDTDGTLVVGGQTLPLNFPISDLFPTGGPGGARDGFVARFSADGKNLLSSITFGGSQDDRPNTLVMDKDRSIILAGQTYSSADFPRPGAVRPGFGGGWTDGFVVKIAASATNPPRGDADGNGVTDLEDVKLVLRAAGGLLSANLDHLMRADEALPNKILTIADAVAIARDL